MRVLTECADGREISFACGDTFELRLVEGPTTGFRWQVVTEGAPVCRIVGDSYRPPQSSVPGRAGYHSWRFQIDRPGRATVKLAHRRAWETGTPPASSFQITVVATE